MARESDRTSAFTFQSSVHSSHVLSCLEEQRQKDLLCDVTVVTESRSFRAHRSVLASCSDYFGARVFGQAAPGLVLNLPDEVTAEGFEPLLQFAYTSKLLLTKENVLEVRNCAAALGFKNLDGACFDFLLPKFFNSSRSSPTGVHRKRCCRDARQAKSHAHDVGDDASPPPDSTPTPERTPDSSKLEVQEKYYRCPKYTKFLQACGKAQAHVDPRDVCARTRLPCSGPGTSQAAAPAPASPENCPSVQSLCSGQICPMIASCSLRGFDRAPPPSKDVEDSPTGFSRTDAGPAPDRPGSTRRSSAEMEVANQLSTWPSVCSLQPALSGLQCPFLRDQGRPVPDECPYVSSVNSDEDSDSSDSDSESGISEKASEVQLPLPVGRVTSMSRNDFQSFLRTYQLSREQLDHVHDVRRRCKNRIAARRCRKRKLDRICNLEREISRLRSEKETLTAEKRHLDQVKLDTYRSYSALYDRLCAEAELGPEQLQVLAKYTSLVECPFSAHASSKAHTHRCSGTQLPPLAPGQPETGDRDSDQMSVLHLGDS